MKFTTWLTALLACTVANPLSTVALAKANHLGTPIGNLYAEDVDMTTASASKGYFFTDDWEIKISRNGNNYGNGNSYIYAGRNSKTKDAISLAGGRLIRSEGKHFYKWRNAGTVYLVTWQPDDPNFARLQIFNPSGKEIFNKLMKAIGDDA
jgi:hypothetical protein